MKPNFNAIKSFYELWGKDILCHKCHERVHGDD